MSTSSLKVLAGTEGCTTSTLVELTARDGRGEQGGFARREVVPALAPAPQDPLEQLWGAIAAVFHSWMAEKAETYRRVEKITGLVGTGRFVADRLNMSSKTGILYKYGYLSPPGSAYIAETLRARGEAFAEGERPPGSLPDAHGGA